MTATNDYKPDSDVEQLRAAINYSRKHPDKFDYQGYLNDWQCKFAIYIDGLAKHIANFLPTPKQKEKAAECLEAIRIGLVRCEQVKHENSES